MPSRFDPPSGSPPNPEPRPPEGGGIDASKRYDVYCHRYGNERLMVYRNVAFVRATPLFTRDDAYSKIGEFVELKQADGRTFFLSRMSIIAFCEHGTRLPAEFLAPE